MDFPHHGVKSNVKSLLDQIIYILHEKYDTRSDKLSLDFPSIWVSSGAQTMRTQLSSNSLKPQAIFY